MMSRRIGIVSLAVLCVGLLFVQVAVAQESQKDKTEVKTGQPPAWVPPATGEMTLETLKPLNLDEGQKAKIGPLLKAQSEQMKALRENETLSPQERMTQMRAIRAETRAKIQEILTPEQQQKYEQLRQEMRQRARERMGDAPRPRQSTEQPKPEKAEKPEKGQKP